MRSYFPRTALFARCVCVVLSVLGLSACNQKAPTARYATTEVVLPQAGAEQDKAVRAELAQARPNKTTSLAYEHVVTVELDQATLPSRLHELQVACASDQHYGCAV